MLLFKPVWFDSMGAKSSCILVETDVKIVIDPGIAIMHPSFPASKAKKLYWKEKGKREIKRACKVADIIIISHYHHDHYIRDDLGIYANKILLVKNPNEYINESQRKRAETFFTNLFDRFEVKKAWKGRKKRKYPNPMKNLQLALNKNFGEYNERRKELLEKGMKWFEKRAERWQQYKEIPESKLDGIEIRYPEGKTFRFGKTLLKFTLPLFHGIEFSRVGWIFATVVEYERKKLIHTSDVNGPIIEDYAEWIIKENPEILILDGPATYMLGYMLNKINLNRAIENVIRIMKECSIDIIIYDHHLPRERKFIEHTQQVWKYARKNNIRLLTAAEYKGIKPVVLE